MEEEWRPIPWSEGYEASNLGRIRSLDRYKEVARRGSTYTRLFKGTVLVSTLDSHGYMQVSIPKPAGRSPNIRVHKVIMEIFGPEKPDGQFEILHKDDDHYNNSIANLKWGTREENMGDRIRNGKNPQLNKTHCPYNHILEHPNLVAGDLKRSKRSCRACASSRSRLYYRKKKDGISLDHESFLRLANEFYKEYIDSKV